MEFRELDFGFARAETERTEKPTLLTNGYFDEFGYAKEAMSGPVFLFLGYKGSGKSSLVNHLDLTFQGDYNNFCTVYQLEDFSFANFSKIVRGNIEPESKFPDAWGWLLLILALDSFSRDEGLDHPDKLGLFEAVQSLRKMGFMPNSTLRHIANLTSKKNFKLSIPNIFEHGTEYINIEKLNDIPLFVENMKRLIKNVRSTSKHYILIDGMDDILTSREVQYKSLGSLIFEVDRLNDFFKNNYIPIKFVIVCRTDLYERISGANKNKIKQDKSRYLDWYKNPRNPEHSMLIAMATKKAGHESSSIIESYFPKKISGDSAEKYLLDLTRHTPRDFLTLLKKIAEVQRAGAKLTANSIHAGSRIYSNDYFIGEVEDELEGYTSKIYPKDWIEFIGSFGRRRIPLADIEDRAKFLNYPLSELHEVLSALFECSAIGTVVDSGGAEHFTFKYRNRNSRFVFGNDISVHKGLRKALNIP